MSVRIREAIAEDVPLILELIQALADFEKLSHECVATELGLTTSLFGANASAEVRICEVAEGAQWRPAGFALFFTSYSTFLAKAGIYLEDLFIKPEYRSRGFGKLMLAHLAQLVVQRGGGRLEWSVLDWNKRARDFYEDLGAAPMDEWTVHRLTGQALTDLSLQAL